MPSWNDLVAQIDSQKSPQAKLQWLNSKQVESLQKISQLRGNRNVIFYASAFLQKPMVAPLFLMLSPEDINGFMSVMFGMDWKKNLTLILHTPGGMSNACETIVEYLRKKFDDIEVIVPTYAMSAGTMISLASNKIIMGCHSQLGPIDPQLGMAGRSVSALDVIDAFNQAKEDILADLKTAHVWAPILATMGPSLNQEAKNALSYGENLVRNWLSDRMFAKEKENAFQHADQVAQYFNSKPNSSTTSSQGRSHGRRIDREEARKQGLIVEDLESDQDLQEAVLTTYHLATIGFENTPAGKLLVSNHGRFWIKNVALPQTPFPIPTLPPPPPQKR